MSDSKEVIIGKMPLKNCSLPLTSLDRALVLDKSF